MRSAYDKDLLIPRPEPPPASDPHPLPDEEWLDANDKWTRVLEAHRTQGEEAGIRLMRQLMNTPRSADSPTESGETPASAKPPQLPPTAD